MEEEEEGIVCVLIDGGIEERELVFFFVSRWAAGWLLGWGDLLWCLDDHGCKDVL